MAEHDDGIDLAPVTRALSRFRRAAAAAADPDRESNAEAVLVAAQELMAAWNRATAQVADARSRLFRAAHDGGMSWYEMGQVLGITQQAARAAGLRGAAAADSADAAGGVG